MEKVILCNLSDAKKVIDEERLDWIFDVLESLGVPDEIYNAEDIRDFRYDMEELGIEVDLCANGDVNVYKKHWHQGPTEEMSGWIPPSDQNLVAQWKEPKYIRKIDGKNMYYEIHLNEWSVANVRRK